MVTIGGDLPVARIGLGTMCLTGPDAFGLPRDRRAAIATLRRTIALGVWLVDTADSYGPHVSESLIADALFPYPPELVIATKSGFEHPAPDVWRVSTGPIGWTETFAGCVSIASISTNCTASIRTCPKRINSVFCRGAARR